MKTRVAAAAFTLLLCGMTADSQQPRTGTAAPQPGGGGPTRLGAPPALRKFNVTVRRFDPRKGLASGEDFVLPVDSPDEEHAISATLSNAVAFTTKAQGSEVLSVAFTCVGIQERR